MFLPSFNPAAFNSAAINAGSSCSRSRSGGMSKVRPFRRWYRSSLNFPCRTRSRNEQFDAQMIRAFEVSIRSDPSRSNPPYSRTRRILTCASGLIACRQVFDSQPGERLLHGGLEDLLLHTLAQLPNWFERIFNQRPATDNDMRVSPHSDAQRQNLPCAWRDFIPVE